MYVILFRYDRSINEVIFLPAFYTTILLRRSEKTICQHIIIHKIIIIIINTQMKQSHPSQAHNVTAMYTCTFIVVRVAFYSVYTSQNIIILLDYHLYIYSPYSYSIRYLVLRYIGWRTSTRLSRVFLRLKSV
jgi:hypothetical protein